MKFNEYKDIIRNSEIRESAKDELLDKALEAQRSAETDTVVINETVEVIKTTPWYKKRVFAAAASLALVAGIAAPAALMISRSSANKGTSSPVASTEIQTTQSPTDEQPVTEIYPEPDINVEFKVLVSGELNKSGPSDGEKMQMIDSFEALDACFSPEEKNMLADALEFRNNLPESFFEENILIYFQKTFPTTGSELPELRDAVKNGPSLELRFYRNYAGDEEVQPWFTIVKFNKFDIADVDRFNTKIIYPPLENDGVLVCH